MLWSEIYIHIILKYMWRKKVRKRMCWITMLGLFHTSSISPDSCQSSLTQSSLAPHGHVALASIINRR